MWIYYFLKNKLFILSHSPTNVLEYLCIIIPSLGEGSEVQRGLRFVQVIQPVVTRLRFKALCVAYQGPWQGSVLMCLSHENAFAVEDALWFPIRPGHFREEISYFRVGE